MKFDICVVTGTRAEYGLLKPVLYKLKESNCVNIHLVVTGTHLSEKFGNTQEEIIQDGFDDFITVPIPLDDDSKAGMAYATGVAVEKFACYFATNKIDLLLILGDRYEILAVAIAAHMTGIPIAHISGGDVTEGAVDDAIRHCITKMSVLHFPGCEQSRKRIIQMGENPDTVFNVGEIGVENCLNVEKLSRAELSRIIDFSYVLKDYAVVTFHPVTMENNTGIEQVRQLIEAMVSVKELSYIITMSNADSGGRSINEEWVKACKDKPNWLLVSSLGVKKYLSAVQYSRVVIGNSSSGIIEVPVLGVPTVNIGDRQKGRMTATSVINCSSERDEIVKAIRKAIAPNFIKGLGTGQLPFGNGKASTQIVDICLSKLQNGELYHRKKFFDLEFNYGG